MKITDLKFEKKSDYDVFRVFLRTCKESGTFGNLKRAFESYSDLTNRCLGSRRNHPHETYGQNLTYWPSDAGFCFQNKAWHVLMFYVRLINVLNLKDANEVFNKGNVKSRTDSFFKNSAIKVYCITTQSDIVEIRKAYKKCGDNFDIKNYGKLIEGIEEGIPF